MARIGAGVKGVPLAEFKRRLKRYAKSVPEKAMLEVHGTVTLEVFKHIVERTPVLTGMARNNWNVSINAPNPETTRDVFGGKTTGEPMKPSERNRAMEVIRNIQQGKLGTKVFISNHLPYIYFLEHGSSLKAPEGIVEGAVLGALEVLHSKGLKVRK